MRTECAHVKRLVKSGVVIEASAVVEEGTELNLSEEDRRGEERKRYKLFPPPPRGLHLDRDLGD